MAGKRKFERIQWSEKYVSGLVYLDNHRHNFIDILNELIEVVNEKSCETRLPMIFHRLAFYVEDFFTKKEMALKGAVGLPTQTYRAEHDRFTSAIAQFHDDFRRGRIEVCFEMLVFLIDWFDHYVTIFGPEAAAYMKQRGYE